MDGQRKALIVANDQYEHEGLGHLLSPGADADALGSVLRDPQIGGFDVRVVRNEPAHAMGAYIEDLFSDSRPDDVLLLHFSCHGLKSESGELFFAARNTRPNRLGSTAVSADFVQRCMRASRSRRVVLLLDCCYGGAFSQGVTVRASGDPHVFDSFPSGKLGGGRGRAVITASSSMEYAFEGDRLADETSPRPSVFTAALVEGMATGDADRDEDGWISLNELYDYVFDRVREKNPNQTPGSDVEMQGELYIARSRRRRVRPQAIPADLRAAMSDANMFSRLGAVTELRSRLMGDNLPVAAGAGEALREIASTDIQFVAEAARAALDEAASTPAAAAAPADSDPAIGDDSPSDTDQRGENARPTEMVTKKGPWTWRYRLPFPRSAIIIAGVLVLAFVVFLIAVNVTGRNERQSTLPPPTTSTPTPSPSSGVIPKLGITSPTSRSLIGSKVPGSTGLLREAVSGTATLNTGETLWIFLYGTGSREYYFETLTPLTVVDNAWRVEIDLTPDPGTYILYAVIVNATDTQDLKRNASSNAALKELPPNARKASVTVQCCK